MVVDGVVAGLVSRALDKVITKMNDLKPKDVQLVMVQEKPDSYSYTEIDRATGDKQKWDMKNPDAEFKNVLKQESKVREISVVPDTVFKSKGMFIITVDDIPVVKSKSFTAFTDPDYGKFKINQTIARDKSVKVFLLSSRRFDRCTDCSSYVW